MKRIITTLTAGAFAVAFAVAPAAAQNRMSRGNTAMNPGVQETIAPYQTRGWTYGPAYGYAPGAYYGQGYNAYSAQPGVTYGPFGYQPGYGPYGLGTGGAGAIGADN